MVLFLVGAQQRSRWRQVRRGPSSRRSQGRAAIKPVRVHEQALVVAHHTPSCGWHASMAWLLEAADQRDGTDKAAVQPESKHGDPVAVPGDL